MHFLDVCFDRDKDYGIMNEQPFQRLILCSTVKCASIFTILW